MGNEKSMLQIAQLTPSKSPVHWRDALINMKECQIKYGHPQLLVAYSDSPEQEKSVMVEIFPELDQDIGAPLMASERPLLQNLEVPEDVEIILIDNNAHQIDSALDEILSEQENMTLSDSKLKVYLDMECPVIPGQGRGRTSVITIKFSKKVWIMMVPNMNLENNYSTLN